MPRNASGNFSLPPVYRATPGTTIRSDQHNTPMEDIAQALTDSLPRNGSAPMTGNLPMGGRRITGLGLGTASNDAVRRDQVVLTGGTQAYGRSLLNTASFGDALLLLQATPNGRFFATPASGGLQGGGDFTENRNLSINFATQAEAEAGTVNNRAMTPLRVQQYVANYLASVRPGDLYSYAMLRLSSDLSGTARNQGFTTIGSNLYYATAGGNDVGASPQGTWVLMGRVIGVNDENATSVWYRIS